MKFKVLNTELEFDFLDAEESEKMEAHLAASLEEYKSLVGKTFKTHSESIKAMCRPFWNLFDGTFGEGTAEKVFEGRHNFKLCMQAMEELTAAKNNTMNEITGLANSYTTKVETLNREQRRKAKKKGLDVAEPIQAPDITEVIKNAVVQSLSDYTQN